MKIKTNGEAIRMFDMLGIKFVSTNRQMKNGTYVWELPIGRLNANGVVMPYRYATYASGYVRDVSSNPGVWQINKKCTEQVYGSQFGRFSYNSSWTHRQLITSGGARMVYLANYILKNRYNNKNIAEVSTYVKNILVNKGNAKPISSGGGYTNKLAHAKAKYIQTPIHLNIDHNRMINSCESILELKRLINHYKLIDKL
tara:strand:+ start:289 stop:885 length:597 start_codon:yes stop_codon:yes gene_type:complete